MRHRPPRSSGGDPVARATALTAPGAATARGFSLVELLIAMALGLVLLSGMVAVFVANKRSTELNGATADMQENARFAMNAIAADIRMAGHQGCAPLDGGSLAVQATSVPMSDTSRGLTATAVSGYLVASDTAWTPQPNLGSGSVGFRVPDSRVPITGTHALAVQFGEAATAGIDPTNPMTSPSSPVVTDAQVRVQAGDYVIVSNCFGADLFVATSVTQRDDGTTLAHAAGANASGNLTEIYGATATIAQTRVMRFASNVYFVADTGLTNRSGDPITALYQQSLPYNDANNPPTELIQGVENLRLSLGVENDVGQLRYVDPDDPYDPADVRAVRVGLLLSSWDRISPQDDTTTYMLAGSPVPPAGSAGSGGERGATHPADRRHRLAFNTTVKVRNYR